MQPFFQLRADRSEQVRYDFGEYPISARRGLLSAWPNYAAPSHFHDDLEFAVVLSGTMRYNVNGTIVDLAAGDGIFVNARQIHYGFSRNRQECDFLCILLHPLLLCSNPAFEREFVAPLLNSPGAAYAKLQTSVGWQKKVLRELKRIYADKGKRTAPVRLQSAALKIWGLLLENLPLAGEADAAPPDLTPLKNMVGFIQQKYAEKITLADIAAAGAVGQSKCCKLFGKYFRQTPGNYLNQYRLSKSAELLRGGNLSVTEIAYAVGFGGASYYAETFRKWSGMSPTEYRKRQTPGFA